MNDQVADALEMIAEAVRDGRHSSTFDLPCDGCKRVLAWDGLSEGVIFFRDLEQKMVGGRFCRRCQGIVEANTVGGRVNTVAARLEMSA